MVETLPALPVDLVRLGARAAEFARTSRSPATERAYRSDWADFARWCELAGLIALPAEPTTIGAYLSDRADSLKVATLNRRIAAITAAHRMAGQGFDASHPAIANVLAGIRRAYGTRQDAKTALLTKVEHDRLFGQSVSHQLFSSDGKQCTLCLGVADRLDLEFRWPSGPNSRSGSTISRSRDAPRRLHHAYGRPGVDIAADGSCVLAGPGAGPGRGPKRRLLVKWPETRVGSVSP